MTRIRNTGGVYIHIAGKLDRSPSPAAAPSTEGLRTMLSDLREPLTGLSDAPAVISANLFRAAWLHQLGPAPVVEHHDHRLGHYDVAVLVGLANPHSVSDLLDHDAVRQLLYVLHTHGREVVITPARNIGATAREPAHGALSLIRHVLAPEAMDGEAPLSDAAWPAREPALEEREILVPTDPANTPLRSIQRAELAPGHARELVIALARSPADEKERARAAIEPARLPHLYWEVSPWRESGRPVLGARGRSGVRAFVGGASHHVLQHAHRPLLTLPRATTPSATPPPQPDATRARSAGSPTSTAPSPTPARATPDGQPEQWVQQVPALAIEHGVSSSS